MTGSATLEQRTEKEEVGNACSQTVTDVTGRALRYRRPSRTQYRSALTLRGGIPTMKWAKATRSAD